MGPLKIKWEMVKIQAVIEAYNHVEDEQFVKSITPERADFTRDRETLIGDITQVAKQIRQAVEIEDYEGARALSDLIVILKHKFNKL